MNTSDRITDFIFQQILDGECDFDIATEDNLLLSGIMDSLAVMRLVAWLEEEFRFSIAPEDVTLDNFQNIAVMSAYVSEKAS